MRVLTQNFTPFVAAILLFIAIMAQPLTSFAQTAELDELFEQLKEPIDGNWQDIEKRIWKAWSRSGSDAMDLLLTRGRDAMQSGDVRTAISHFSALIDHAPEFAEGWNARATAFFMIEEYGLSVSDIQTTLALNPRHFGAMAGLGMILERTENYEDALKAYEAAIAVHPHRRDLIEGIERVKVKTEGTSL